MRIHTPTPAALRAAFQLECEGQLRHVANEVTVEARIKEAALVIDRETGLRELIAAASDALESLRRLPNNSDAYRVTCIRQLEIALAKANQP